jgi:hypothetical protein
MNRIIPHKAKVHLFNDLCDVLGKRLRALISSEGEQNEQHVMMNQMKLMKQDLC